jgi:hypothetical protein
LLKSLTVKSINEERVLHEFMQHTFLFVTLPVYRALVFDTLPFALLIFLNYYVEKIE